MKKLFAILFAAMMLLSLAACGENTDKPSGDTDKPGTSQGSENNKGGDEEAWTAGFNLPGLTTPEGCTAELRLYNDKCVIFEKSGSFTEAEVDAFAKQVWDSCMEVSSNGIYVGDAAVTFEESKGSDTYSWSYTNAKGNKTSVRIYFGEMDSGKLTFEIY